MKWKVTGQFLAALGTLTILLTMVNFGAFFYFFGLDTSPEKQGYPYSAYPESFTLRFKDNIVFNRGIPFVSPVGQEQLKKEKAWIQILDGNGTEVYSMNKPGDAPRHYTPGEIVHYHKYDGTIKNSSLFISWVSQNEARWTYVIGFPTEKIRRYTMYYSETKFFSFWEQGALVLLLVTILTVVTIGYLFGRRLTKPLLTIIGGIKQLAEGNYSIQYPVRGLYKDVYTSLNELSSTLQWNEKQREKLETMREEWITNLSHDLRTPLSSIKGYGEVLAEPDEGMPAEEREKYAGIIVGKADYMGALLDDLKITYQLKNELLPLKKQEGNIVELIRSVVIELLNNPRYEERDIEFETTAEYIPFLFDSVWLQRAFMNVIYNAVVHNPLETKVRVSVRGNGEQITVEIEDDGKGIEEEELANVFERYYRGTNTEGQHEGSGLGMAIARQIITAHQGEITVKSEIGTGTKVVIVF